MPNTAATKVTLEIDGAEFDDITNFTEDERPLGKQVKYMNKLGYAATTTEIGFSFTIVVNVNENYDFLEQLRNATTVVEYQGGDRVIFLNCNPTSIGEKSSNGEDEITYDISWASEQRKSEPA
jgi:hypothetical protein|tara:strand:- start:169 stop:537 length:369 start_codon:yes stop_codon:yes gene_type:complete